MPVGRAARTVGQHAAFVGERRFGPLAVELRGVGGGGARLARVRVRAGAHRACLSRLARGWREDGAGWRSSGVARSSRTMRSIVLTLPCPTL